MNKLGLSPYQWNAYKMLVHQGTSTALEISRHSHVPHGKIYVVLQQLVDGGFVQLHKGTPKRYTAVDPQIAVSQSVEQKEQELELFKQESAQTIAHLGELSTTKKDDPLDQIKIIEGYKNYLNFSTALHKQPHKQWSTISELSTYKPHIDAYKQSKKKGIHIRMLTSQQELTSEKYDLWKKTGISIRVISFMPTKFSVMDTKQVTLRLADKKKYVSVWLDNESLAQSMKTYFETLWKESKPFSRPSAR